MERNEICTDFYQIISGAPNQFSSAYLEAAEETSDDNTALKYLKNFIASIENVASKSNAIDKRISDSKGNIKEFVGYDNINKGLKFLTTNKTPAGNAIVSDLRSLFESIEKYQSYYTFGYRNNTRLFILEYECATYLLVSGLSMALSYCFEVTDSSDTTKVMPRPKAYFGITGKKITEMAEQLRRKDHASYLDSIEKAASNTKQQSSGEVVNESVYTEGIVSGAISAVSTTMSLIGSAFNATKTISKIGKNFIKTIKKTAFGIIPLIRGVIYLSYKRKADSILSLDQNIIFIEKNIEILQNKQNMDPKKKAEIIKKQQAIVKRYRKRAEKLRAEFAEGEKAASAAIQAENQKMQTPAGNGNGDFVLESVIERTGCVYDMLCEGTIDSIFESRKVVKGPKKTAAEIEDTRRKASIEGKRKENKYTSGPDKKRADFNMYGTRHLDQSVLDKILKEFHQKTEKETIRLKLNRVSSDTKPTASKIGGHPYWPEGKEYPKKNGKDMMLLVQINFADMPHIQDFPSSGIFQMFVGETDYMPSNDCMFVFHDSVGKSIDVQDKPVVSDSPIPGVYYLSGTKTVMYPCDWSSDHGGLNDLFMPIFNKYCGTNIKYVMNIYDEFDADSVHRVYEYTSGKKVEAYGTRIGGYPNFTQYDPREGVNAKKTQLLVQIDSENGIMWGDCGIANIFIAPTDLKNGKLTNAYFHWDCY